MYAFTAELDLPVDQVIERLKSALATHKMGVVSEVGVQAIMKAKMNREVPPYRLLGICGPGYAHRVIEADADMGALLPCGCAVYQTDAGRTRVALQNPASVAALSDKAEIRAAMDEAGAILAQVAAGLAT